MSRVMKKLSKMPSSLVSTGIKRSRSEYRALHHRLSGTDSGAGAVYFIGHRGRQRSEHDCTGGVDDLEGDDKDVAYLVRGHADTGIVRDDDLQTGSNSPVDGSSIPARPNGPSGSSRVACTS